MELISTRAKFVAAPWRALLPFLVSTVSPDAREGKAARHAARRLDLKRSRGREQMETAAGPFYSLAQVLICNDFINC